MESLETRCVLAADLSIPHVAVLFAPGSSDVEVSAATQSIGAIGAEKITLHATPASYGQLYRVAVGSDASMTNVLATLRANPHVKIAEVDEVLKPALVSNDTHYVNGNLWGMYSNTSSPSNNFGSQAASVWATDQVGSNSVVVGVIDSGIDISHPDLAPNIWVNTGEVPNNNTDDDGNGFVDDVNGWDFFSNDKTVFDGVTAGDGVDAHGTHVAGTIGAVGGNGVGVAGINWNVKIIPAKFLGPAGGPTTAAIRALDYLTALKNKGVNLVATNNSWGGGSFSQLLLDAMGRSADAKMLFIAAAGNSSQNNDFVPAYPTSYDTSVVTTYDSVVSVAAIDRFGSMASFSSYGATSVDIGAPGVAIRSTTPFNTYSDFDGTSMAAPHVAGAAALYYSMHPTATPQEIRAAILGSGVQTPTASLTGRVFTGGRLNLTQMTPAAPPALPAVSIDDVTFTEGDSGFSYVTLTVSMSKVSSSLSRVSYSTSNGTALAGSDYMTTSGTVTIPPGHTYATIVVPVYGDTAIESDETFIVNLANPVGVDIADGQGVVTIRNDDFATKASVTGLQRIEGNVGYNAFAFTLTLSQASATAVTLRVTTAPGSASEGTDYLPVLQNVVFAPGVTSQTILAYGMGETVYEPDETFYLDILTATNASIKVKRGTATILNDDSLVPGAPPGSGGGSGGGAPGDAGSVDVLLAASFQGAATPEPSVSTKAKKK